MRGSSFIALFGLASALSGSLIGCGDDDGDKAPAAPKVTKSGENESCTRSDDCDEGLVCINNVCLDSGSGRGGSTGTGGSSTGGTAGRGGSTSSPLGGEGESCARRADCQQNLSCFNQRCTSTGMGEGGGANTPTPTVGGVGETCQVSADCARGLLCIPGGQYAGPGVGFVGVCTLADSGILPTGKVCGAECLEDEDCCELPVELQATLGVKSCTELDEELTGVNCGTTTNVAEQALCFALGAYCDCEDDAWSCDAGSCTYVGACSEDGLVPEGCPSHSRSGRLLTTTCDTDSELCQAPAIDPPCSRNADCEGLAVIDDPTDTCVAGECVCFESACYRRCAEDLDCRAGRVCDEEDVCMPADACTSDLTCQRVMGDIRARCVERGCTLPCRTDLDCNAGGLIDGAFSRVCNAGMCEAIGCVNDNDCPGATNGVRLFCTTPAAATGALGAESAITQ